MPIRREFLGLPNHRGIPSLNKARIAGVAKQMARESHNHTLGKQRLRSTLNSEAQRTMQVGDKIKLTIREYPKNPMRISAYDKPRTASSDATVPYLMGCVSDSSMSKSGGVNSHLVPQPFMG